MNSAAVFYADFCDFWFGDKLRKYLAMERSVYTYIPMIYSISDIQEQSFAWDDKR